MDDNQPDRGLHFAYLRLRAMIPGAFNTPHAPSPETVWAVTETALAQLVQDRDNAVKAHRELVRKCEEFYQRVYTP